MTKPRGDRVSGYADGAEAMALAGELYRRGESIQRMSEVTGLTRQTVTRIAMGEAPRLWHSTAKAALKLRTMLPDE